MAETAPPIDPDRDYDVRLSRPVTFLSARLKPIDTHTMSGGILLALIDAEGADCVDSAQPR